MKVEIKYNPYKMKTEMLVDGIDVCKEKSFAKFKRFIDKDISLQTWIEPISYYNWNGFLNELSDPERNNFLEIIFSGRKIDFKDLKQSLIYQNNQREELAKIKFKFNHHEELDDKAFSKDLDDVVKELHADWFVELVKNRGSKTLKEHFKQLDTKYERVKSGEFRIVFSGMYSSGKSTIINCLTGHNILPTSQDTCTTKNCRIKHNGKIGKGISLTCYDSKNVKMFETEVFNNSDVTTADKACLQRFKEINPKEGEAVDPKYKNVNTVEIGVDLSHLYPASVDPDKFKIVFIDTPGINSSSSVDQGVNVHAETAFEAISDDSKPITVLCASATEYQDERIGQFMSRIVEENEKEAGVFKDRFLFILNKADGKMYEDGETIEEFKKKYVKYLNDSNKWGKSEKNTQAAADFIPKVFLVSALVQQAINNDAMNYSDDELWKDSAKEAEQEVLLKFIKRLGYDTRKDFRYTPNHDNDNYHLSQHCDIPEYQKENVAEMYARNQGDEVEAAYIQCGMPVLTDAIRDYIERYAYPLKVRELLSTFESILLEITSASDNYQSILKEKYEQLGKNTSEKEVVEKDKKTAEDRRKKLEKINSSINTQLNVLDYIEFDISSSKLKRALENFKVKIERDETVKIIRSNFNKRISSGQISSAAVKEVIDFYQRRVVRVFDSALIEMSNTFSQVANEYKVKIDDICNVIKKVVDKLKESGILSMDDYNIENTVIWKTIFEKPNYTSLTKSLQSNIIDASTKQIERVNEKKVEWKNSRNPLKRFGAKFRKNMITETIYVDGSYSLNPLAIMLDESYVDLEKERERLEYYYAEDVKSKRDYVKKMIEDLISEIRTCIDEIEKTQNRITVLGRDISKLNAEIKAQSVICNKLNQLAKKIEGV